MTARESESQMLQRCVTAVQSNFTQALNQREANVFRVASMVMQSRLPREAAQLMQLSDDYFAKHPDDLLPAVDVVRRGWVLSLPRLRDMLSLHFRMANAVA